jgi:cell division protease FtsH
MAETPNDPLKQRAHGERHPQGWRITPGPDGRGAPPPPERKGLSGRYLLLLVLLLMINIWVVSLIPSGAPERVRIPYSPTFLTQVRDGNVVSVSSRGSTVQGEFRRGVRYPPNDPNAKATVHFATEVPTFANSDQLSALLEQKGVVVNAKPPSEGRSLLVTLLISLLPTLLIIGLIMLMIRSAAGAAGGGLTGFARSRARRVEPSEQEVTFGDVAGVDEAKAELVEIVDFLRNPDKYRKLGGRIPRGVLLTGSPGTGKTLLARALAGEAGVPFFSISASEFVEMLVGVGASRVRDLFTKAKEAAPAIIFIDELDAIGRRRAAGVPLGGHDEREQTLNQILTEMDGFDPSIGVIVLSATNRPEILDPALLRPGRFDRRVTLQPPDQAGRRMILDVHTRSVPLDADVDLDRLASTTPGMVGADLANIVNEAALIAARREHTAVTMADFHDALEKLVLGSERRIMLSPEERERTAYHEAGHALVAMLTPGADPVRKVSIIPRGKALGVTLSAPEADRFSYDEDYLEGKIRVLLGGRVAEEIVFGNVTTGAENDIREVTDLARNMVGLWGMSETIGPVAVIGQEEATLVGSTAASAETQHLVDEEVRRMVDEAHSEASGLLEENRDKLAALAHALLERETLDEDEAYAVIGLRHGAQFPAGVGRP